MLYYQSDKLIERIDWEKIMKMPRYAGGHDEQMKGLFKGVKVIAHYNEGDYQGMVATCIKLKDTKEIVIYNDYYGSCSGCDAWEGATDDDVRQMCRQLACGALIFKNLEDCKSFLVNVNNQTGFNWSFSDIATRLLEHIRAGTIDE